MPTAKGKFINYAETSLQVQCVQWFKMHYPDFANLCIYVNNNSTNAIAGRTNRLRGTVAGFPDNVLFVPRGRFHGLCLEFKRPGEKPKAHQLALHAQLLAQGYPTAVIDSFALFMVTIRDYLAKNEASGKKRT